MFAGRRTWPLHLDVGRWLFGLIAAAAATAVAAAIEEAAAAPAVAAAVAAIVAARIATIAADLDADHVGVGLVLAVLNHALDLLGHRHANVADAFAGLVLVGAQADDHFAVLPHRVAHGAPALAKLGLALGHID